MPLDAVERAAEFRFTVDLSTVFDADGADDAEDVGHGAERRLRRFLSDVGRRRPVPLRHLPADRWRPVRHPFSFFFLFFCLFSCRHFFNAQTLFTVSHPGLLGLT